MEVARVTCVRKAAGKIITCCQLQVDCQPPGGLQVVVDSYESDTYSVSLHFAHVAGGALQAVQIGHEDQVWCFKVKMLCAACSLELHSRGV